MIQSLRTLLAGLIDYAGLFPPAKLEMGPAAEAFARHLRGEHEFALGRFICPVSRLEEFSRAAAVLMPGTFATSGYREYAESTRAWAVSAILDWPLPDAFEQSLDAIDAFNAHHAEEANGLARIDTIELKVTRPSAIDEALDELPDDLFPFFEFDLSQDCRGFVAALAGNAESGGAGAKLRCGGVKPELIPAPEHVGDALCALVAADVPFKATAGLHHPWRAVQSLTYEASAPHAVMHGFVNVFLGAALARAHRLDRGVLLRVLTEEDARAFVFTEDRASWRDLSIDTASLAKVRETFALSYGSCSFDEPFADLARLGLL
ncbi:MAG: hypothetical protein KF912_09830 [Phycisphaeraceae bacterium]|nr:hypothetical protein [Phycisphaeraceae bacterium]MBX3367594.1 hypothetical protein [Phycisphaeraceae bacterium]